MHYYFISSIVLNWLVKLFKYMKMNYTNLDAFLVYYASNIHQLLILKQLSPVFIITELNDIPNRNVTLHSRFDVLVAKLLLFVT